MASIMWNESMSKRIPTTWILFETFVTNAWTYATFSRFNWTFSTCCCSAISQRILSTSFRLSIDFTSYNRTITILSLDHIRFVVTFISIVFNSVIIIAFTGTSQFKSFDKCFRAFDADGSTTFRGDHIIVIESDRFVHSAFKWWWRWWRHRNRYWINPITE